MPSGIWGMIRYWKKHHSLFTNTILNLIRTALTLVPGRKYTQVVDASFRLTQVWKSWSNANTKPFTIRSNLGANYSIQKACLLDDPIQGRTCLKANIDEQEFVLCSLNIKTVGETRISIISVGHLKGHLFIFIDLHRWTHKC